jgi:hypothetical protein
MGERNWISKHQGGVIQGFPLSDLARKSQIHFVRMKPLRPDSKPRTQSNGLPCQENDRLPFNLPDECAAFPEEAFDLLA